MKKRLVSFFTSLLMIFSLTAVMPAMSAGAVAAKQYTFDCVDGSRVSTYSDAYRLTITVFGRDTCPNTQNVLRNIISLGIDSDKDVNVLFVDCDGDSKETIKKFADSFEENDINFCYDTNLAGNSAMWYFAQNYTDAAGSVTLPVTVFSDSQGNINTVTTSVIPASKLKSYASGNFNSYDIMFNVTANENYDYAYDVLDQLNALRASVGAPALTMDSDLLDAAMQRAAETSVYYSHTRPNGKSCFTIYSNGAMAENIAIGYGSPSDVMNGWTNSQGHYTNMVDSTYKSVGIGCFTDLYGRLCWVQYFSSKAPMSVEKSGTVNATRTISATSDYLNLHDSVGFFDPSYAQLGEKFYYMVINTNVGWSYCEQEIFADFSYSSSDPEVISIDASGICTVNGCGETTLTVKSDKYSNISYSRKIAISHKYGSWTVTKPATAAAQGVETRKCSVCGKTETRNIPALGGGTISGTANMAMSVKITRANGSTVVYSADISKGKFTVPTLEKGTYNVTFYVKNSHYVDRTYTVTVNNSVTLNPDLHLLGDVNGDGKLSTADVGKVNADVRKTKSLTDAYDRKVADVNGDGKLSTADVGKINAHVRGTKKLW